MTSTLKKDLQCSICFANFRSPRMLPCLHTFCETCIPDLKEPVCPTCENKFVIPQHGPAALLLDCVADRLVAAKRFVANRDGKCGSCEEAAATHHCVECDDFLCAADSRAIHRVKSHASHTVRTLDDAVSASRVVHATLGHAVARVCAEHQDAKEVTALNLLTLFCETCQRLVCMNCVSSDHKTHKCAPAVDVVGREKERLGASIAEAQAYIAQLDLAIAEVEETTERLAGEQVAAEQRVRDTDAEMRKALDARMARLLATVGYHVQEQGKLLASQIAGLRAARERVGLAVDMGARAQGLGDPGDAVGLAALARARVAALLRTPCALEPAASGVVHVDCDTRDAMAAIEACGDVREGARVCDTMFSCGDEGTVAWTASAPPGDVYDIELAPSGGGQGRGTSLILAGVLPGTYAARVRPVHGDRLGPWSRIVSVVCKPKLGWHAATASASHIEVSSNKRRASSTAAYDGTYRNVMSTDPTDDFTVALSNQAGAPYPGGVNIGFTPRETFSAEGDIRGSSCTLYPSNGKLYRSKFGKSYCASFSQGTVRCVADRSRGTIAFSVDGVDKGIAWTDIPPGPLHAVVLFYYPGIDVELVG